MWTIRAIPNADTDLQQLSIPANVLRFETLTNLDYYVHFALAANIHPRSPSETYRFVTHLHQLTHCTVDLMYWTM